MRRVATCALALVLACEGAGDIPEIPLDQLCESILEAYCERRVRCLGPAILEYQGFATVSECVQTLQPFCTEECDRDREPLCAFQATTWRPSIKAGRLKYHPRQAFDCFEALRQVDCREFVWHTFGPLVPEACKGLLEGQVEPGGECTFWTLECKGEGMWCEPNGFPDLGCKSGTCQRMLEAGQACNVSKGDICDFDSVCIPSWGDGTCVAHGSLGDDCNLAGTAGCGLGLFCSIDSTCREMVRLDEACDATNGDPCDIYSYCDNGVCTGLPRADESCGGERPTHNCWFAWCEVGAGQFEGTCMPLPTLGEECGDATDSQCRAGRCDYEQHPPVCVELKSTGVSCSTNIECESWVCHPTELVCFDEYCPDE